MQQVSSTLIYLLVLLRVADHRGLRRGPAFDACGLGAPAVSVHGSGEWRLGDVEVAGNKRFGARRCEVLPREAGEHWFS